LPALALFILLGISAWGALAAPIMPFPSQVEQQETSTQNSPAQGSAVENSPAQNSVSQPSARQPPATPASSQTGQQSLSTIFGTVLDSTGAVVPGARVSLIGPAGTSDRTMLTSSSGEFAFAGLAPTAFRISATSPGMGTYVSPQIQLSAGETHQLTGIILPIASTSADIRVTATMKEIATEQVKAAEKQRVLGVVPNFYVSYIWNAAPLSSKQKYALAFHSVLDPVSFVLDGAVAGYEQAGNEFPSYGQGAQGYGKRFGAAYADDFTGTIIGGAILPSLLHQDPRYFYRGSGTIRSRLLYAISTSVICKGDNGHFQPNYSSMLGSFASGAISNAYYPPSDRGLGLTISGGFIGIASQSVSNVLQEFLIKKLTPKIPKYEQGKP
jgi:Carboxypeptidase regulatory-like domain